VFGRRLIVERVCGQRRPQAHVAAKMGVSRKTVGYWLARFDAEGEAGLAERSSRPRRCPRRTPVQLEQRVLALRVAQRRGQDWIGAELGVPARTVSRILRRHRMPYLRECDPLTRQPIRGSKTTAVRYERARPGELVHMDVTKIGRIPEGGGWRAATGPAESASTTSPRRTAASATATSCRLDRAAGPGVAAHRCVRPPVAVWTAAQTAQFLHATRHHRLDAAYHLIALRGLRRGEASGLRWCDLDLDAGVATVNQQLQQYDGRIVVGPPKTARSV
jgi:transposase